MRVRFAKEKGESTSALTFLLNMFLPTARAGIGFSLASLTSTDQMYCVEDAGDTIMRANP